MTKRAQERGSRLTPIDLQKIDGCLGEVQGFLTFVDNLFELMAKAEIDTFSPSACLHVSETANAAYRTLDEIHDRVNGEPTEVEGGGQ